MLGFPAVFICLRTFLAYLYNSIAFVFTAEIGYYSVFIFYYTLCIYFAIYSFSVLTVTVSLALARSFRPRQYHHH